MSLKVVPPVEDLPIKVSELKEMIDKLCESGFGEFNVLMTIETKNKGQFEDLFGDLAVSKTMKQVILLNKGFR